MKYVLNVWRDGRIVGVLTQDGDAELRFAYALDWLRDSDSPSLSGLLPKREAPFVGEECSVFFGGLLPEGSRRRVVARVLGVSSGNDFSLLRRLGGDVAGTIQILPLGETPRTSFSNQATVLLDGPGLARVLEMLPRRPFLAGIEGIRQSLAGVQPKLGVVLVHGKVALAMSDQPTTHILKLEDRDYPEATENEAFVMRLAAAVGLDVASAEPRVVEGQKFLLVERYDRVVGNDGRVRRFHQMDLCQELGLPSVQKYEEDEGPGFRRCFELLRRISSEGEVDAAKLADAAIFNVIAGNADAHGKNFSILYGTGGPRLAPLYDLTSTLVYPELSVNFAMKIGERKAFGELDAEGWAGFAADAGLDLAAVRRRAEELSRSVAAHVDKVKKQLEIPGLDQGMVSRLAAIVRYRAEFCLSSFKKTDSERIPEVPVSELSQMPGLPEMDFGEPMDVGQAASRSGRGSSGPSRGGGPER